MRQFEYAFYVMTVNDEGQRHVYGDQLNKLGLEGWEAVCLIDAGEPISLLLKREISTAPAPIPVR